jgi:hypothetical protein
MTTIDRADGLGPYPPERSETAKGTEDFWQWFVWFMPF